MSTRAQATPLAAVTPKTFFSSLVGFAVGMDDERNLPGLVFVTHAVGDAFADDAARLENTASLVLSKNSFEYELSAFDVGGLSLGIMARTAGYQDSAWLLMLENLLGGPEPVPVYLLLASTDDALEPVRFEVTACVRETCEMFTPIGETIEYGRGPHVVVSKNRWTGHTVVHRFERAEDAESQLQRNMEADQPLAGMPVC